MTTRTAPARPSPSGATRPVARPRGGSRPDVARMHQAGPTGTDAGTAAVWLMITPVLILVLAGISLDLWGALSARGRIAAIADEAAVAGATAIAVDGSRAAAQQVTLDAEEATRRALEAVDVHPDGDRVTARGAAAGEDLVSVTVEGHYELLVLRLVGVDSLPISVIGHAAPRLDG